jgi:acyl-CoA reductase-like NAD-dependent aldehyde dehydrogenase
VLRAGVEYESLDAQELTGYRDGQALARVSRANAGLIRRDLARIGAAAERLRSIPMAELVRRSRDAARRFLEDTLPLEKSGAAQSPEDYVRALSATSGLPHALVRANMTKVATVLGEIERILGGLTRGLDLGVLDTGLGRQGDAAVCFAPTTSALGVVLPSNSPGVNSIWIPAAVLKTPVVLKPGREEPWTPLRIVRALVAAGFPAEAFSFYPTDHEGSAAILELTGRSLLFGDAATTKPWAADRRVQLHGPGWSKVLLGPDQAARYAEHVDVLAHSVADNGGRSCINASTIVTPSHAEEIADALARRLAPIAPLPAEHPDARLCAFPDPKVAEAIDAAIERGLAAGGAEDVTARHRPGPRRVAIDGATYLLPTILRCDSIDHPLARTEYLFPFASVVQVPEPRLLEALGPSLVVTAITKDDGLRRSLLACRSIDRLNLGPLPTSRVEWDQPHEGNLFEFLYQRRAIQRAEGW